MLSLHLIIYIRCYTSLHINYKIYVICYFTLWTLLYIVLQYYCYIISCIKNHLLFVLFGCQTNFFFSNTFNWIVLHCQKSSKYRFSTVNALSRALHVFIMFLRLFSLQSASRLVSTVNTAQFPLLCSSDARKYKRFNL